jgi:hypothetical protein
MKDVIHNTPDRDYQIVFPVVSGLPQSASAFPIKTPI